MPLGLFYALALYVAVPFAHFYYLSVHANQSYVTPSVGPPTTNQPTPPDDALAVVPLPGGLRRPRLLPDPLARGQLASLYMPSSGILTHNEYFLEAGKEGAS